MGDQALHGPCRGRGMRWFGGPKEVPCYGCKGTGLNLKATNSKYTNWRAEGYPDGRK